MPTIASAMSRFIIIFILFFLASSCKSQVPADVKAVIDTVLDHAESASMYRNGVDWPALRGEVYSLAAEADSIPDLGPAIQHMLTTLGDEHGRFLYNYQHIAFYNGPEKPHLKGIDVDMYNQIQLGQTYAFGADLIAPGVGYVRIVGMPMGDNTQMSQDIQDAVCAQVAKGAEDWVVDLRYNGGGNMFPMVEGLAAIIGDGHVGGAVGLTPEENVTWHVVDGDFYYADQSVQLENACRYERLPKVAVLTSMYTASSGEVVAVVFKGREKTRFFGEPTHGLTTVNDWTPIDSLSVLMLSVSTYQSRDGVVHKSYVEADEHIPYHPNPLSDDDEGVKAALDWLKTDK
ncbi:MAG: S41 family peptidase [Bacteroidota bacterium]